MGAQSVTATDDDLEVDFVDGRTITVPLAWFPRLTHATPAERANWRLNARGQGIHGPDLDEDISVASLLAGRRSGESPQSLEQLASGAQPITATVTPRQRSEPEGPSAMSV